MFKDFFVGSINLGWNFEVMLIPKGFVGMESVVEEKGDQQPNV